MIDNRVHREAPVPRPVTDVEEQVTQWASSAPSVPTDEPMVPLSVRVPAAVRKRLRMAAFVQDLTVQDAVMAALQEWLAKHE